jgi:hypothetical protein
MGEGVTDEFIVHLRRVINGRRMTVGLARLCMARRRVGLGWGASGHGRARRCAEWEPSTRPRQAGAGAACAGALGRSARWLGRGARSNLQGARPAWALGVVGLGGCGERERRGSEERGRERE